MQSSKLRDAKIGGSNEAVTHGSDYAMLDNIIGSLLLTCLSGFLFAAVGTGMAADMESSVLADFLGP